jgi:hypothetical protein
VRRPGVMKHGLDVVPSAFAAKSEWQELNLRPHGPEPCALHLSELHSEKAKGVGFEPTHRSLNRPSALPLGYPSSRLLKVAASGIEPLTFFLWGRRSQPSELRSRNTYCACQATIPRLRLSPDNKRSCHIQPDDEKTLWWIGWDFNPQLPA